MIPIAVNQDLTPLLGTDGFRLRIGGSRFDVVWFRLVQMHSGWASSIVWIAWNLPTFYFLGEFLVPQNFKIARNIGNIAY